MNCPYEKKRCISVSDFYMKVINNKHTLLYNRPTIHSIQRYNGLCELTNCNVNIWAIHMTLNTLGCLWTINSMLYCVFRIPNVFFCHSNDTNTTFEKHMKKMCGISVSDFYMKIINNKLTLLYNRPTIHSKQRYNGLCELTDYIRSILWAGVC